MLSEKPLYSRPNVLRFSCRRGALAPDYLKKGTISRAEGGQLQAPVGPRRDRALAAPVHGIQSNIGWGKQPDR